jgi:hypothetical protein
LESLDQDTLWSDIKPTTNARLWVIEHFRVLPTDERFVKLSESQVSLLYGSWLHSLPDDYVKREYWASKKEKAPIKEKEEEALRDLGYSDDDIAAIKKEIGNG